METGAPIELIGCIGTLGAAFVSALAAIVAAIITNRARNVVNQAEKSVVQAEKSAVETEIDIKEISDSLPSPSRMIGLAKYTIP